MLSIPRFCSQCSKLVQPKGDVCPDCGTELFIENHKDAFLSGPFVGQGTTVTLPSGVMLLDRFRVINSLGNGRFGTVYVAEDRLRSMKVALKVVGIGPCCDDMEVSLLQREMIIHTRISEFKYIIQVYDLHFVEWSGSGLLLLSMEYANGDSFRKYLIELADDLETRRTSGLDYFKQACHGVGAIHDAKIIHLDLKPENLIFSEKSLKVTDLGTAYCHEYPKQKIDINLEILLPESGTPTYMSPEQFIAPHPDELDLRSDIYSLGVILHELLHPKGRPPFGGSPARLRDLHINVMPPIIPDVNENLARVISRCLKKNPDDRYQSVWELLDDLKGRHEIKKKLLSEEEIEQETAVNSIQSIWEKAKSCLSAGSLNEAKNFLDEVLIMQPDHFRAQKLRQEIRDKWEQAQQFYSDIAQNIKDGDPSDLLVLLKDAINIYPNYPPGRIVQVKLEAKIRQYRQAIEEGVASIKKECWEAALKWLEKALKIDTGATHLKQVVEDLSMISEAKRQIQHSINQKEFNTAIHYARSIDMVVKQMKERIPAFWEEDKYDY
jgi:serine/threonine protein kinase